MLICSNLKCWFYRMLENVRLILVERPQRQLNAYPLLRNAQDSEVMKVLDDQIDEAFKELMV